MAKSELGARADALALAERVLERERPEREIVLLAAELLRAQDEIDGLERELRYVFEELGGVRGR